MKQDEFESLSIFEQATITPAYQLGFQAGAASRDAYIEQLELALLQVRKAICGDIHNTDDLLDLIASRDAEVAMWVERVNSWTRDCERFADERDQLRTEMNEWRGQAHRSQSDADRLKEENDQLRAQINVLREALEEAKDCEIKATLYRVCVTALASTSDHSLAEYRNKVIEQMIACYSPDDSAHDYFDKLNALKDQK